MMISIVMIIPAIGYRAMLVTRADDLVAGIVILKQVVKIQAAITTVTRHLYKLIF
jgi:hypothetical protein